MSDFNESNNRATRINGDRRFREKGPPNGCERRKSADRRLPNVEEDVVTEAEWFKRMTIFKLKLKAKEHASVEKLQRLASGSSN